MKVKPEVEALKGALSVTGWREAHVALPGQRLDQRAGALVEDRFQVPVGGVGRQRVTELGVAVGDRHGNPLGVQSASRGRAETGGAAADQRGAGERLCHGNHATAQAGNRSAPDSLLP